MYVFRTNTELLAQRHLRFSLLFSVHFSAELRLFPLEIPVIRALLEKSSLHCLALLSKGLLLASYYCRFQSDNNEIVVQTKGIRSSTGKDSVVYCRGT